MIVKGIFLIVVENAWQNKNGRGRGLKNAKGGRNQGVPGVLSTGKF